MNDSGKLYKKMLPASQIFPKIFLKKEDVVIVCVETEKVIFISQQQCRRKEKCSLLRLGILGSEHS